jgi:hypothetical protein
MREHLVPLARRGVREAVTLLTAPDFPKGFEYLFDWYAEFTLWHDWERSPTWSDWAAWERLMGRRLTPLDLRLLRQIHVAYRRATEPKA